MDEDPLFGEDSWEKAESTMQKEAARIALKKAGLEPADIRYIFAGDLLGQLIATFFGMKELPAPLFGLYGACSTAGEALQLGAMTVNAGYASHVLCVASSHFGSAEKQFRYPLAYANQRPLSATWTVTGCGAFVVGNTGRVRITGITTGKIVDYGVRDSMNMGACMAPAAADTIAQNLQDFGRTPEDYDQIITGDLGKVGKEILLTLMKEQGVDISRQHADCGIEIYDAETQDTHSGGSGCGCSAGDAGGLYPGSAGGRPLEAGAVRAHRGAAVHGELQRRADHPRDCPRGGIRDCMTNRIIKPLSGKMISWLHTIF